LSFGESAIDESVTSVGGKFFMRFPRPDGFEPPTTWFEARRDRKVKNFDHCK